MSDVSRVGARSLGCWLAALCCVLSPSAEAGQWSFSSSLGLTQGSYGQSESISTYSLFGEATYRSNSWRIGARLPLYYQDSTALRHSGGIMLPPQHNPDHHDDGSRHSPGHGPGHPPPSGPDDDGTSVELGDLLVWGELALPFRLPIGFHLSALALAKAPLADEDTGLGTGEWDYGLGGRLAWGYGLSWATLDLVYWQMGDPIGVTLENVVAGTLIVGRRSLDRPWFFEGLLRGYTSAVIGNDDAVSIGAIAWRWMTPKSRLGLAATAGLTDSAPDFKIRLIWTSDRWPERRLAGSQG